MPTDPHATPDRAAVRQIVRDAWIDAYNEGAADPDDYIDNIVAALYEDGIIADGKP